MDGLDVHCEVADIAAGQWGIVTTRQAVAAGVSRLQLSRLAAGGMLTRLAHGVYELRGAAELRWVELRAAWVGLDPGRSAAERLGERPGGAVVSHASAADLFGFGDMDADWFEFTVPVRRQVRRGDVRLFRGDLTAGEVTVAAGLPVTIPERTIFDLLATHHDTSHVAGVLADAVRARRVDTAALAERVAPLAAGYGYGVAPGDGVGLVDHLLAVGGGDRYLAADRLAGVAHAVRIPLAEVDRARVDPDLVRLSEAFASTVTAQLAGITAAARSVTPAEVARTPGVAAALAALEAAQQEAMAPVNAAIERVLAAQLAPWQAFPAHGANAEAEDDGAAAGRGVEVVAR